MLHGSSGKLAFAPGAIQVSSKLGIGRLPPAGRTVASLLWSRAGARNDARTSHVKKKMTRRDIYKSLGRGGWIFSGSGLRVRPLAADPGASLEGVRASHISG